MLPSPTTSEAPAQGNAPKPNPGEPIPLEETEAHKNEKHGEASYESPGVNVNGLIGALNDQSARCASRGYGRSFAELFQTAVESLTKAVEAFEWLVDMEQGQQWRNDTDACYPTLGKDGEGWGDSAKQTFPSAFDVPLPAFGKGEVVENALQKETERRLER
ncbi:hypothetical protein MVEN_01437300 [Mycena venus]|uniref:Uncharacterized protein n=1 Tax=Mycena venus TaxID=2733690 RepID=A0A8H7CT05_9AGAR|nr:hypothetical protein MVEN_01437300 [Mycena venus]